DLSERAGVQPLLVGAPRQFVDACERVAVEPIEVRSRPALLEVDRRGDASVLVHVVVRTAQRVRVRQKESVPESTVDLELQSVVLRLVAVRPGAVRGGA